MQKRSRRATDTLSPPQMRGNLPCMLYGLILVMAALVLFTLRIVWNSLFFFARPGLIGAPDGSFLYYCGIPVLTGVLLIYIDLRFLLPKKRAHQGVHSDPVQNKLLTAVLTAFNDELAIGLAVADFIAHPLVKRVLVIDNNSVDDTRSVAEKAGATVICEKRAGYGNCVYRAFEEALKFSDTEMVLLCEGDRTFRAADIEKFLAYVPHAEIVNGTRIVEQLRERDTQLSTFIYYGNFVVGKLLELKHIGRGTFTDVGTTYKLCRTSALEKLLPHLDRKINLEFNAHFLDTALELGIRIVECPITFFARMGLSKGGNINNSRALKTGLRMIVGMLVSWRLVTARKVK